MDYWKQELFYWIAAASLIAAMLVIAFAGRPTAASTVTYTDEDCNVTGTEALAVDGRFRFRIKTPPNRTPYLPIMAVLVTDDTGQMAAACYPILNGQEILVTSEVVVAAQPVVTIRGRSFGAEDCTGPSAAPSNYVRVEFVPEPSVLLAPLPE